jgi:arylformamidase
MAAVDYEAEYNVHALVPEHPQVSARREHDAKAYRAEAHGAEFNVSYGPSPRQIYDVFPAAGGGKAPLALYIHGGGWRALAPSFFSHVAKGANAHGVTVALAGYDLCPDVTIATIIEEVRAATLALWRRYRQRVFVFGHSAGGHLCACLLATDWTTLASDAPGDLVPAAYTVSGVFDLTPLTRTTQNEILKLDPKSAHDCSPLFWKLPPGRKLDAVVGRDESSEFIRQSRTVAEAWAKAGADTRFGLVDGNHFTALEPLADPASAMTKRLAEMAKAAAALPL